MPPAPLTELETVFTSVVTGLLALGGTTLFIMLLSAGFKFLTSGGDQKGIESAKNTITNSILGLVLLASSFLILRIIGQFTGTGTTITLFTIFRPN